MMALGWMNVLWMGLFAAIIFGEKMWLRGIWVARAAGLAFTAGGILAVAGIIPADSLAGNIAMVAGDNNNMTDNAAMTG